MSSRWYSRKKKEYYYNRAKKSGYRARSAYKLIQINKKFDLIHIGDNVVDLGAAPGGWSQIAVQLVGEEGKVVGVDLDPIKTLEGAEFIRGDMREERIVKLVKEKIPKIDVGISDMSPNITGNYSVDQALSFELAMTALLFFKENLKKGGSCVMKIFEGEDFPRFIETAREYFSYVKPFRPGATRNKSSEIYIVCKNRK